ncbi:MAG: Holliday junction resolvase RuvX [Anaerolineae bacterium]
MRYLSLDLGDRRIGVAVSDSLGMIARPLEVFQRTSRQSDFQHIRALVDELGVETIVVGLPINMDGTEGGQADWVRDYTSALRKAIAVPVVLWDERLSTEEAKEIMRAQGREPRREEIDAVAAAVILQGYLDAHRSG